MRERGTASIVNISSLAAVYGLPNAPELAPYYLMSSLTGLLLLGPARRFWAFLRAGVGVALAGAATLLAFYVPSHPLDAVGVLQLLSAVAFNGLASASKHHILRQYGAAPIDYRSEDFVNVLRQAEPGGLDIVLNGMDQDYFERSLAVLRRGGMLVHYGGPQSFARFWLLLAKLGFYNLLPNGKKIVGYGTHRLGTDLFKEDWATLFDLLAAGKIKPVIAQRLPFSAVIEANRLLENGRITGNLVLTFTE